LIGFRLQNGFGRGAISALKLFRAKYFPRGGVGGKKLSEERTASLPRPFA
jgi:hypothetical protein